MMIYASLQKPAVVILSAACLYVVGGFSPACAEETKDVLDKLRGKWLTVKLEEAGKEALGEDLKVRKHTLTFSGEKLVQTFQHKNKGEVAVEGSIQIDATASPWEMDWSDMVQKAAGQAEGQKIPVKTLGIFELDGDTLKIHLRAHLDGKDAKGKIVKRPTDFTQTMPDTQGDVLITLQRDKP